MNGGTTASEAEATGQVQQAASSRRFCVICGKGEDQVLGRIEEVEVANLEIQIEDVGLEQGETVPSLDFQNGRFCPSCAHKIPAWMKGPQSTRTVLLIRRDFSVPTGTRPYRLTRVQVVIWGSQTRLLSVWREVGGQWGKRWALNDEGVWAASPFPE